MKTLVIEDDLKSQCLLAKVLAERGHNVTTFENAEQAILAYQKEFYPLLFVDAGLPGMDGLQFCRWIRSQAKGDKVFIIVATEQDLPSDVSQVLELGANDFLSKPYELNSLRARLSIAEQQMERFFEQQQLEAALEDETRRWTEIEADMARIREEFETQLQERNEEISALQEQLDREVATRRTREDELNARLETDSKTIEELQRLQSEQASRLEQTEAALNQSREAEQNAQLAREEVERQLLAAKEEFAGQCPPDEDEIARLHGELQEQREEGRRLLLELAAIREAAESQTRGLQEQLARVQFVAEEEQSRRKQAESELTELREQLGKRVKVQTTELLELSEQLKAYLKDRKKLDEELNQTRDELAQRVREQMSEVLRLTDEVKSSTREQKRLEEELTQARQQSTRELQQRQHDFDEAIRRLQRNLDESRQEAVAQLTEMRRTCLHQQTEMERLTAGWEARDARIRQLEETAATHREARKQVEARWRVFIRLGLELNKAQTSEEVARATAVAAEDLMGWEIFSLDSYAEQGDWIHPVLNLEKTDGQITEVEPFHPGPQPTTLMRRVLEDGPQLVLRPAPACSQTDLVVFGDRARRSASLLYVPVKAGCRVLGFVSLRSVSLNAYDGEDIQALMALASQCAGAMDRLESRRVLDADTGQGPETTANTACSPTPAADAAMVPAGDSPER